MTRSSNLPTGLSAPRHRSRKSRTVISISRMVMLLAGLIVLVLSLPPFFNFPWLEYWLVPIAAIYLCAQLLLPRAWLVVLPLATVGIDIAPWTGRFAYNELDLLFLMTLCAGLISGRYRLRVFAPSAPTITLLIYILVVSLGYSGWSLFALPHQASLGNFYYGDEYSYKLIKGLFWGVALVPMWGFLLASDKRRTVNMLVIGISSAAVLSGLIVMWELGTLGVVFSGFAWERALASLPELGPAYQVTGILSDMHAGGMALQGVSVLLFPVTLYGAVYGQKTWLRLLGLAGIVSLVCIAIFGFSFTTVVAYSAALVLYVGLTSMARRKSGLQVPPLLLKGSVCFALLVTGVAFFVASGNPEQRTAAMGKGLLVNKAHWSDVIESSDDGLLSLLMGNGIGEFPLSYLRSHPDSESIVGSFKIAKAQRRDVLRIGGGSDLILGQRTTVYPYVNYTVSVELRAERAGSLLVSLCERNINHTRGSKPRCVQDRLQFGDTDGAFESHTIVINSAQVGEQDSMLRWPTMLGLGYEIADGIVDIGTISLLADDINQLRNSSFKQGLDYWFNYNDVAHQSWHVQNMALQLWFENGWLGLLLLAALLFFLVRSNFESRAHDSLTPVYTTAVLALCVLGLFGSPLDSARVSWLFYFFLSAGLAQLRVNKSPPRRAAAK